MKALTLRQPWATLVAIGAKKIETRSWKTNYRGPLAIHASKRFPKSAREHSYQTAGLSPWHILNVLTEAGYDPHLLPTGVVVATCILARVVCIEGGFRLPKEPELSFGDYTQGRWAWFLRDVSRLPEPVPATGHLGLWKWLIEEEQEEGE